jgi:HAD superfamily hydrolase (TIGR01509 family)
VTPALLIDLDGTLVDTVAAWHAAYLRLADELGVAAPADLWPRVAGRSMRASLEVYGDAATAHDADALIGRLVALASEGMTADAGWSWLPGARELLTTLRTHAGTRPRVALVTSAWRAFTLPLLSAALGGADAVDATFDAIVCGDDVTDGKPAPESHLRAAALLDVAPEDCLVIEDSPTGVAAAEAAGMVVLVVPHAGPATPAAGREVRGDLVGLTVLDLAEMHARLRSGVAGRDAG